MSRHPPCQIQTESATGTTTRFFTGHVEHASPIGFRVRVYGEIPVVKFHLRVPLYTGTFNSGLCKYAPSHSAAVDSL